MSKTNKNRGIAQNTKKRCDTKCWPLRGQKDVRGWGCRWSWRWSWNGGAVAAQHVVLYLCCSFALGIQKIHFRKTILTWQDNDKQSDRATHHCGWDRGQGRGLAVLSWPGSVGWGRGWSGRGYPVPAHWLLALPADLWLSVSYFNFHYGHLDLSGFALRENWDMILGFIASGSLIHLWGIGILRLFCRRDMPED